MPFCCIFSFLFFFDHAFEGVINESFCNFAKWGRGVQKKLFLLPLGPCYHFCTGLEYSRVVDKGHRESFLSNCSKTKLVVVTFNRNFLTVAFHASTTHPSFCRSLGPLPMKVLTCFLEKDSTYKGILYLSRLS